MKWRRFLSSFFYLFISPFLIYPGCSSTPNLKMTKSLPPIVKEYKHITLYGNRPGMMDTGIYLKKGALYTILATGSINFNWHGRYDVRPEQGWPFMVRVGKNPYFRGFFGYNSDTYRSNQSGNLYVGTRRGDVNSYGEPANPELYQDSSGSFSVDIIVWNREDWVQITDFFEKIKERDPKNKTFSEALDEANRRKQIFLAEMKASEEIKETKNELQKLKREAEKVEKVTIKDVTEEKAVPKEVAIKTVTKEKPPPKEVALKDSTEKKMSPQAKPVPIERDKLERVSQLEVKLAKLMETLSQLEEMKQKFEEERKKSSLLAQELEEKEKKEKDLLGKLEQSKKTPPIIVIASPKDESKVEVNIIHISGVAEDDQGLVHLEIYINNKPIKKKEGRGLRVTGGINPKRVNINERIPLEKGENQIRIRAVDSDGLWAEKTLTIQRSKIRRNVWAVIIGINDYPNVRKLKFAVNDAKAFYDHLVSHSYIPAENVTLLLDWEATLTKLRSTLGTHLKRKAGKDDMVIIYFAGHGSTEKDVMNPDGDGLEKYLLPYDADPKDLYASALPMREISHIFNRVQSERLVFLADSCYSGASGGRTIGIAGTRSNISENFLDRVASGKGRVIITASGSNEVSAENEDLQHGVFTYYLIEGLQGKADMDKDGLITVDEVYRYVSEQVPRATGQEQHPVKKGTVEGQLILGVIE